MPRHLWEFKEAKAVPYVMVSRYCQGMFITSRQANPETNSIPNFPPQVKKKMLYSSSFDALKKSLVGVQKYIQATDLSEASREANC